MTCMEAICNPLHIKDTDVGRQASIQPGAQFAGIGNPFDLGTQMGNLRECVHSRIRSSGSLRFDFESKECGGSLVQVALHGARVLLLLPSAVLRPVVLERQLPRDHLLQVRTKAL